MQTFFFRSLLVSSLVLVAAVVAQNASADPGDTLRWQSVIGIAQTNGVVGIGTGAVTGGAIPAVCATEPDVAFLIRVGAGKWIANGTVLR
jgi:hypothetical protein